jgi:hypothetical protein
VERAPCESSRRNSRDKTHDHKNAGM